VLGRLPDPGAVPHRHIAPPPKAQLPPPQPQAADPEWTVSPDDTPDPEDSRPTHGPATGWGDPRRPRRAVRLAQRIVAIALVCVLITGVLALTHIGPFHSSARAATLPSPAAGTPVDIGGVWHVLDTYGGAFYVATMQITSVNLSSGAFSGTITSPVGVEALRGTVSAHALTFTISLGHGDEQGSAIVTKSGTKLRIQGSFSNPDGGHGSIIATRTSS
jgi:hypothetical protein